MNISDVIAVSGRAGFFNRDLAAVKAGAKADGSAGPSSLVCDEDIAAFCGSYVSSSCSALVVSTSAETLARKCSAPSPWCMGRCGCASSRSPVAPA